MKFLKKLKSGNFWVSLISAGVLIAEGIFDVEIKTEHLNQIILGLMGMLTVFGIVSDHGDSEKTLTTNSSSSTATLNSQESEEVTNASNIRSICDTINLLLNKVSINSSNQENLDLVHNEVLSALDGLLNEKSKVENFNNTKTGDNQTIESLQAEGVGENEEVVNETAQVKQEEEDIEKEQKNNDEQDLQDENKIVATLNSNEQKLDTEIQLIN